MQLPKQIHCFRFAQSNALSSEAAGSAWPRRVVFVEDADDVKYTEEQRDGHDRDLLQGADSAVLAGRELYQIDEADFRAEEWDKYPLEILKTRKDIRKKLEKIAGKKNTILDPIETRAIHKAIEKKKIRASKGKKISDSQIKKEVDKELEDVMKKVRDDSVKTEDLDPEDQEYRAIYSREIAKVSKMELYDEDRLIDSLGDNLVNINTLNPAVVKSGDPNMKSWLEGVIDFDKFKKDWASTSEGRILLGHLHSPNYRNLLKKMADGSSIKDRLEELKNELEEDEKPDGSNTAKQELDEANTAFGAKKKTRDEAKEKHENAEKLNDAIKEAENHLIVLSKYQGLVGKIKALRSSQEIATAERALINLASKVYKSGISGITIPALANRGDPKKAYELFSTAIRAVTDTDIANYIISAKNTYNDAESEFKPAESRYQNAKTKLDSLKQERVDLNAKPKDPSTGNFLPEKRTDARALLADLKSARFQESATAAGESIDHHTADKMAAQAVNLEVDELSNQSAHFIKAAEEAIKQRGWKPSLGTRILGLVKGGKYADFNRGPKGEGAGSEKEPRLLGKIGKKLGLDEEARAEKKKVRLEAGGRSTTGKVLFSGVNLLKWCGRHLVHDVVVSSVKAKDPITKYPAWLQPSEVKKFK